MIVPESKAPSLQDDLVPSQELSIPDRFLNAKQIGERLGIGATCVRKWRREGKIELRKMFGTRGMHGMSESQLIEFINGGNEE